MKKILLVILVIFCAFLNAQIFTDINAGLRGVSSNSSAAWGDYDNDGDLDVLVCGNSQIGRLSILYRNDEGVFTNTNAGLIGVLDCSASWGDYDNDGDLDVLMAGLSVSGSISKIYRNDSGGFTDINAGLTGITSGSIEWGDYDNDGDLDILIAGSQITKVYRNDYGIFSDINAGIKGVYEGSAAWGDYDNDGDLDVLLSGENSQLGNISKIYRNDSGVFSDINAGLIGLKNSSVAWSDYDSDGDLDILLSGYYYDTTLHCITKIYRNDPGIFIDINAGLTGFFDGSVSWADYDNDGDADVLLTGYINDFDYKTKFYQNNTGVFVNIDTDCFPDSNSDVAWGDYDNDGDLDVLIAGLTRESLICKIFRNDSTVLNSVPTTPENLSAVVSANTAAFSWNKSTDSETPQNGLSYNLYIGTSSMSEDKMSPMSNISNGYRRIVSSGNANQNTSWTIKDIPDGNYYWGVQAVDNIFAGSEFSDEDTFTISSSIPIATLATEFTSSGFTSNWTVVTGALGYRIDVDDNSDFSSPLANYNDLDVGNVTSKQITGLASNTLFYYRLRAYDEYNKYSNSNAITARTLLPFTSINSGLGAVHYGSADWGDYDNDGDLDVLLTGDGSGYISKVYRNESGIFTDINAGLTGVNRGSVAWGDYDNDGDLDILFTGNITSSTSITKIYRNDSGLFTDVNAVLPGVKNGAILWGDYDNDGDLDILLSGSGITKIYKNDSGIFSDIEAGLAGVSNNSAAWGDYDNDGDLDILLSASGISKLYRNDSGVFTDIIAGLPILSNSSVAWGDYDNDGDLDILLCGRTTGGCVSKVYRNDSGIFADINAGLTGIDNGSLAFGDYDNDGDLDILIAGLTTVSKGFIALYQNESGIFTVFNSGISAPGDLDGAFVCWSDYDNDGDLDITYIYYGSTRLYRNNIAVSNTVPGIPTVLSSVPDENAVTLSWNKATDNETPQNGLSYNLYVGTASMNVNTNTPMSNIQTGYRKVVNIGNANQNTSWTIKSLPNGMYYWSVQAIDHAFAGSDFAGESTFTISSLIPIAIAASDIAFNGFTANWLAVSGATGYRIDVDDNIDFSSPLANYNNLDVGNVTSKQITGLTTSNTIYYYRLRSYDESVLSANSNIISVHTLTSAPVATAATGISMYEFTANWESVTGANGYKIDVDDNSDFSSPLANYNNLDVGDVTSKQITGLTPGKGYYYRLRYYNLINTYDNSNTIVVTTWYPFTGINHGLAHVHYGSVDWGDYDNDGDLDVLLTGDEVGNIAKVYKNDSSVFTDINAGLTGVNRGSTAWGDYDNDGDLDILYTGNISSSTRISKIYRNDSGVFTDVNVVLPGVSDGTILWGDYDNDGDLDILLSGSGLTKIYKNDSGVFTDINVGLTGVTKGSAAWGDYDNDGDLDILLTGSSITKLYRNDFGVFTDVVAGLQGVTNSSAAWGDYDNDGDLDILLCGRTTGGCISKVYRNDSGIFADINAGLTGVDNGSLAFGDYDNDGDLDILLAGLTSVSKGFVALYKNDSGIFTVLNSGISSPGDLDGAFVAWSDYDNDCDLDITYIYYGTTRIFRNNIAVSNTVPDVPTALSSVPNENTVTLSWNKATDNETPQNGLSYNLYVGTTSMNVNTNTPMSNTESGYRKVVNIGNANQNTSWTIKNLPNGMYYWSVQAIDHAFAGSDFVNESTFTISSLIPIAIPASDIAYNGFTANWLAVSGATGYRIDVDDNIDFSSPLANYNDLDVGNVTSKQITGLTTSNTIYYYRLRSYDEYVSSANSNIISVLTLTSAPVATAATGISMYEFTANWESVTGANGYKIDVDDNSDFSSPLANYNNLDVGNVTSKQITGLTPGKGYYYRLRYYNLINTYDNSNTIVVTTWYPFTSINSGLAHVDYGSADWGDYDNDGDLDVLLTGYGSGYISKVYKNDSGVFTDINAGLTAINKGSVAWGDYDNDGDLDILLTGLELLKIYRNDSGVFTDLNAILPSVSNGTILWGDYDNDGDLDILISGSGITKIYKNDSGVFTDVNAGLAGVSNNSAAWGDYDNDGDLDILLAGSGISILYRNDSGVFTDIIAGLPGVYNSSAAWGDYDNDGDLDILLTGYTSTSPYYISKLYRNNSGLFTDVNAGLTGVDNGSLAFGDYDNDGDLDILLAGLAGADEFIGIYQNNSGIFTIFNSGISTSDYMPGAFVAWSDYDNDGDLDITYIYYGTTRIFRNNIAVSNTVPGIPTALSSVPNENAVTLSWNKATDNETPQNGLSYNLYVGTTSMNVNTNTPMSDTNSGYRKVVNIGNANQNTAWTIKNLPNGVYYWSVQAIDHAFAGSDFAGEKSFLIGNLSVPANVAVSNDSTKITVSWNVVQYANSYKIYASSDPTGTFIDVSLLGNFEGTTWRQDLTGERMFYYVIAVYSNE